MSKMRFMYAVVLFIPEDMEMHLKQMRLPWERLREFFFA